MSAELALARELDLPLSVFETVSGASATQNNNPSPSEAGDYNR